MKKYTIFTVSLYTCDFFFNYKLIIMNQSKAFLFLLLSFSFLNIISCQSSHLSTSTDTIPPTPIIISASSVFFDNLYFDIYAQDFNIGSFDNETADKNLIYSFDEEGLVLSRLITCDDFFNTPVNQQIFVHDEAGNTAQSSVNINIIISDLIDCFPSKEIPLRGTVKDIFEKPVQGVKIKLQKISTGVTEEVVTDENGFYEFLNLNTDDQFSISLEYDFGYFPGVSTLDLVLIQLHILDVIPFDNPYAFIAADINNDQSIKANDLSVLRKLIIGIIDEAPNNQPWKFIDASIDISNDPLIEFIDYSSPSVFTIPYSELNFIAIQTGNLR